MSFQTSLKLIFTLSQNVDMLKQKCDVLACLFVCLFINCLVVMGIEPKACKTLLHCTIEQYTLYFLHSEKGFP